MVQDNVSSLTVQFATLCPDAHAAHNTWQSSILFSDSLNGCHGTMTAPSTAPDDCRFEAAHCPTAIGHGRRSLKRYLLTKRHRDAR